MGEQFIVLQEVHSYKLNDWTNRTELQKKQDVQ